MNRPLDTRLAALADALVVPREDDGTPATLTALMPCEPAIGEVAVACWTDSGGGELVELVRLDGGERVDDQTALREALTLLAMVETVEELASFDQLGAVADELRAFPGAAAVELGATFAHARERALEDLAALAQLAPGDTPRIARTAMLDDLGARLRDLERSWEQLEQAAELWSDAYLADRSREDDAVQLVQDLWRILGAGRRGPLARAVSTALHEGREAGRAMAAAVAAAHTS